MKIIVKINKFDDVLKLNNADGYLISSRFFSYRFDESFCVNKTKKLINLVRPLGKKVYFSINKIFKDKDLDELKEFLIKLKNVDIDGIFFTDFAVFMLANEIGMSNKCIFNHETFLRNSYDILTYQSLGIENIICSKDMNIEDINDLPHDRKNSYGILAFGYVPIYESERKVLSNFKNQYDIKQKLTDSFDLKIKENTRDSFNKIIEQNGITSIYHSDVLCYIDSLNKLENNIDNFIIDSMFFDVDFIFNVVECFKNHKSLNDIIKLNSNVNYTDLFLNKRVGLK